MFIAGLEAAQHLKDQKGNRGRERGLMRQWRCHAFVDPSGGSNDSMTPALAQKEAFSTRCAKAAHRLAPRRSSKSSQMN